MKNKTLQIRIEESDHARLKAEADKLGIGISTWIRMRLRIEPDEIGLYGLKEVASGKRKEKSK